ncbi:MAG: NAD(P)H-quinone oxidoreductase subunit 3 [Anaerolineae bacterium]|nr:NAD(P)H-quinone oxidoreductase subunit 3 [Anaerolineae bacterium]MDL1895461.1 NADH-quinone oxidoreductase subunit A [Anaerolineae bacterium CFX7]RIK34348.1 MAG: NADH-quinone oxidoreductase subunit A [Chloroflexota bacterium]
MLERYALIGLFMFAAITFPLAPLVLAFLFRPKKPNRLKQSTYECGIEIQNQAPEAESIWVQFRVQYYIYAILFVVFDIEVVFVYPWAVALNQMSAFWIIEMGIFIAVLAVALVYAWRKNLLEWV